MDVFKGCSLVQRNKYAISKGMSSIYLKVTKLTFLKLQFSKFKMFVSRTVFWGAPIHPDIIEFSNFLFQPKNQRSGSKSVCGFSIILIFKGIIMF